MVEAVVCWCCMRLSWQRMTYPSDRFLEYSRMKSSPKFKIYLMGCKCVWNMKLPIWLMFTIISFTDGNREAQESCHNYMKDTCCWSLMCQDFRIRNEIDFFKPQANGW